MSVLVFKLTTGCDTCIRGSQHGRADARGGGGDPRVAVAGGGLVGGLCRWQGAQPSDQLYCIPPHPPFALNRASFSVPFRSCCVFVHPQTGWFPSNHVARRPATTAAAAAAASDAAPKLPRTFVEDIVKVHALAWC